MMTVSVSAFIGIPVFGDLDGDGVVDGKDFAVVTQRLGFAASDDNTAGSRSFAREPASSEGDGGRGWDSTSRERSWSGGGGSGNTPEPSTFLLGLMGALMLGVRRRRNAS